MEGFRISRWRHFRRFLSRKYRLVILNDATFAEKFSIRTSPSGIIIGIAAITIVMTTLVISLVAFTTLREYIPGYGTEAERKQILRLNLQADSLEELLDARDVYMASMLKALHEEVETKTEKPKRDTTGKYAKLNTGPGKADIQFRKDFEKTKGNMQASVAKQIYSGLADLVFFAPVKGIITTSYDIAGQHYGIDIVTRQDETIKTTLDGTIIYAGFSAADGNMIHVQHNNNLISIYKHCSAFLKSTGDRVRSGEAIAVVGNSGERSNGPHLHFELWFNGSPINPQEVVAF